MCSRCVEPLVQLAADYRREAHKMKDTAKGLKDMGGIEAAVDMQHWSSLEQTFGLIFQSLATLMALASKDEPEGHLEEFNPELN